MREFLDGLLAILENMSHYTVPFMTVCACMAYIIKPVRCRIARAIKKISRSEEISAHIGKINIKIDMLLEHDRDGKEKMNLHEKIHLSALKSRITNLYFKYITLEYMPSFEKENLVEQYDLYKKLGGNGYLDILYGQLMAKRETTPEGKE